MNIYFTQYLLPLGEQRRVSVDRPEEIGRLAEAVTKAGYHFECEMLTTGEVSLTCEGPDPNDAEEIIVLSSRIVENGPPVIEAVDAVVLEAAKFVLNGRGGVA